MKQVVQLHSLEAAPCNLGHLTRSPLPNLHLVGAEAGYERGSPHSWPNLQGLVFMRRIRGGYEDGTWMVRGGYEEDTRRIH